MELWSLMDSDRTYTGKVIKRGDEIELGNYHLVVFAFIKNHEGKFLIAQRAANKSHAHTWEIPAGASILEEGSLSAVLREVKEEVGINLYPSKGKIIKSFKREGELAYIADIYLFHQTVQDSEINIGPSEVQSAKFVELKEILNLMASNQFMVGMHEVLECIELL